MMSDLAGFGAAGLMGAMWLWERKLSDTRDRQLGDTHARIGRDEQRLQSLTAVVEHNTAALVRLGELQREIIQLLQHVHEESHHEMSK